MAEERTSSAMVDYLGPTLMLDVNTKKDTDVALQRTGENGTTVPKLIALYFSANWCPPCQAFSPQLKEFYKNTTREQMELVYVPYDNTLKEFKKYYAGMPWLALSFENSAKVKSHLETTFKVEGIPSFIVLETATGLFVTLSAQGKIAAAAKKGPQACQALLDKWLSITPVAVEEANLSQGGCCTIQ